ncbi:heme-degrading monooxygenase HmoA [Virgibacillus natechei]|uniref:Heme-degrading monooxygenase HmoA n=1 Tax=Virgibacillus natechei TaxID=1216297 RepID=A0ABS4IDR5_9BACI|nr:antibiotic biosynthesis monooxygenase [Virgibacillus natechei]MBP1968993.1 heme-degrading monooxygenase HmoA [Virgibacillus natechei]UZD14269.1 antibiotic biosynthesis monooxygenase [Virgibacillus natechei]
MKAFMTIGTIEFLQKLEDKHQEINLHLMNSSSGTLAYYEGISKQIFSAGSEYEVLLQTGEIKEDGYVVMNNIPVIEDGKAILEERFKNRGNMADKEPGFQAFRFLKPVQGDTYIVFTQWRSVEDFENWKDSDSFKNAHQGKAAAKPTTFMSAKPFITTYQMYEPNEDE